MRKLEYLSPTSLALYMKDKFEFYCRYLADNRWPREPQTQPMAAGSAFDARLKSFLYKELKCGSDGRFDYVTLFEAQVEEGNRTFGLEAAEVLFSLYESSGALADLMLEMAGCIGIPKFEIDITSVISRVGESGVMIKGKPDIFFINNKNAHVLIDTKCNGFCSLGKVSPAKGFVKERPLGRSHKDAMIQNVRGVGVNIASRIEDLKLDWAYQLVTYGWLCGEDIVSDTIYGIEQLLGRDRVASHRVLAGHDFQEKVFAEYLACWNHCVDGWFFKNVPEAESVERCLALDKGALDLLERPR